MLASFVCWGPPGVRLWMGLSAAHSPSLGEPSWKNSQSSAAPAPHSLLPWILEKLISAHCCGCSQFSFDRFQLCGAGRVRGSSLCEVVSPGKEETVNRINDHSIPGPAWSPFSDYNNNCSDWASLVTACHQSPAEQWITSGFPRDLDMSFSGKVSVRCMMMRWDGWCILFTGFVQLNFKSQGNPQLIWSWMTKWKGWKDL